MLMQGLALPSPRPCSLSNLPPAMEQPSSPPPPPVDPFEFHEPIDTYGQAHVRGRVTSNPPLISTPPVSTIIATMPSTTITSMPCTTPAPAAASSILATATNIPTPAIEVTITTLPRTTQWRHGKGLAKAPHKGYVCSVCGRHKSS